MLPGDEELLSRFAEESSDAAFAVLVERHLNLVYSVARRVVRSPQLAEDVAQAVFIDLARNARTIKPGTPLVAWLHLVSRRTAVDAVRRESRRQAREAAAAILSDAADMTPPASPWTAVEPLLDEAVESLDATDRAAILLRYFENKSLREVGAALGTSDDTAQKRVSRAVDQLRDFFVRRGVTVTAGALAADISAHAIFTAPITLGSAIAVAAGAVHSTSVSAGIITMTLLEKSILTACLVLTGGAALFEANSLRAQRIELAALRQQIDTLAAQTREIQSQRDLALRRATEARQRLAAQSTNPPETPADAALEATMSAWLDRLARLRQMATDHPEHAIPEFQVLTDDEWFQFTRSLPSEIASDLRKAMSGLRSTAEGKFATKLRDALRAYLAANGGTLPADSRQLASFFDPPIAPAMLDRYKMTAQGRFSELSGPQRNAIIEQRSPLDWENDFVWRIGTNGEFPAPAVGEAAKEAIKAFTTANHGTPPTEAAQLLPYLRAPIDPAKLTHFLTPLP